MALEGSLTDFELTDVFQLIQLGQKDGSLKIQSPDDVGIVHFKGGNVIYAKTNSIQGEAAIDIILRWKKGKFLFNPGEVTVYPNMNLPIQQVILEAARRIDELNRIQKVIPTTDAVVKIVEVPESGVEKINLRPEEWKVLSFVDGVLTIQNIAEQLNMQEFDVSRILYGLISTGLVKIMPKESTNSEDIKKEEKKEWDLFGFLKKK
jgi:hypothetical protein